MSSGLTLNDRIEGAARRNHAQFFVEHQDRLADSVDDALRERACIRDVGELFPESVNHATSRPTTAIICPPTGAFLGPPTNASVPGRQSLLQLTVELAG